MDEFEIRDFHGGFDADPDGPGTPPQPRPANQPVNTPSNGNQGQELSAELYENQPPSETGYVIERREHTRSLIAFYYVLGFLVIVVAALISSFIMLWRDKIEFENVTGILVTISGILSGPLGFIIGYYFKAQSDENG